MEELLNVRTARLQAGKAASQRRGDPLREVTDFGDNPGNLRMFVRVPERSTGVATSRHAHATANGVDGQSARSLPLVVALHGCLQTASSYDQGSGWSTLAQRGGFLLLMPGQRPDNNPNRCYNWFDQKGATREGGEVRSIRQMIRRMVERHDADPSRIFVAGLSAGGAMTANLLALHPEIFAAGAILSGLPFGAAQSVPEAMESMAQPKPLSRTHWGAQVRAASEHRGPWPLLSIWHGAADTIVHPGNAECLADQWLAMHELSATPADDATLANHRRRTWTDAQGRCVLESHTIAGMAHGVSIAQRDDKAAYGRVSPFHLDTGICSTSAIARFWGLLPDAEQSEAKRS